VNSRFIPDKKGPRMKKGQFSKSVVTKELYSQFKKDHPEYKDMTWDSFFDYWKEIAETIREESIKNPLGVKLGSYTGEIKLQYLPYKFQKNFVRDEKVAAELGGNQKYTSIVTKGKQAKIKWERRWAAKFNRMLQLYAFEPTREMLGMAKEQCLSFPEKIRMSRNTTGGSTWRKLK
jgi:hypothetical protein